jgi:hypothetical protein
MKGKIMKETPEYLDHDYDAWDEDLRNSEEERHEHKRDSAPSDFEKRVLCAGAVGEIRATLFITKFHKLSECQMKDAESALDMIYAFLVKDDKFFAGMWT